MKELTNEEFNEQLTIFLAVVEAMKITKRISMKEYDERRRKARNCIERYREDKAISVDGYYNSLV